MPFDKIGKTHYEGLFLKSGLPTVETDLIRMIQDDGAFRREVEEAVLARPRSPVAPSR